MFSQCKRFLYPSESHIDLMGNYDSPAIPGWYGLSILIGKGIASEHEPNAC